MRRFTRCIAIALVFGALSAAPAAGDDPTAPVYLALGDSWATGEGDFGGEGGYVPDLYEALKEDFKCSGTANKEAEAGCPQLQLRNLAIAGATTKEPDPDGTLIADEFPEAKALLEPRNFNDNPRDDVEVVTLHTGGNDVTNPIIGACLFGLGPCAQTIHDELAAYRSDLDQALSELREAAGGKTRIVIGTYDNGLGTCFLAQLFPGEAVPLADLVLEGGSLVLRGEPLVVPQGLHDIMRDVGEDYGVEVAEVYGMLSAEDWVGGGDCLHPDDSGYDKVTKAFEKVLL